VGENGDFQSLHRKISRNSQIVSDAAQTVGVTVALVTVAVIVRATVAPTITPTSRLIIIVRIRPRSLA